MAIFEINAQAMVALSETSFDVEGIYERDHLQQYLKQHIGALSPDLMVICEEYGDWVDSSRRIDLLCIDVDANLVVVEIKRTQDGGHMELQALRYAAMVSSMTFKQLVDAHAVFVQPTGLTRDDAEAAILDFLRWTSPDEEAFAQDVRIVLAAAAFSKEITTTVMWLNERDLDITCIRLKPYRASDGRIFVDVQQIIPLPEAAEYQTKIRAKEQAERDHRVQRHDVRYQFWSELLDHARLKTTLFAQKKPTSAGGFGISPGRSGLKLGFLTRGADSEVELEIDCRDPKKCLDMYEHFRLHAAAITNAFGEELEWDQVEHRRASYIRSRVAGGWKSTREEWRVTHAALIDKAIRLEAALRPVIETLD